MAKAFDDFDFNDGKEISFSKNRAECQPLILPDSDANLTGNSGPQELKGHTGTDIECHTLQNLFAFGWHEEGLGC